MKADQVIEELAPKIGFSVGNIVLREREPQKAGEPNWIIAADPMPGDASNRHADAVAEMRKLHPQIDWSGVNERDGRWRVIRVIKKT